jgi:hypothetical protein
MIYVTAIHGDEYIPTVCLAHNGYPQIIANVEALCLGKRCVDKDLNKVFGCSGKSYEERRARQILKLIPRTAKVIDLHTMSAKSDPFAIIVDLKMLPLALTTGMKHIVYMKYNIKESHALINYRSGISVEVGNHNTWESYKNTLKVLKNLQKGKKFKAGVYEVYGIIKRKVKYENFKPCPAGFIPVFAGEKAYSIIGLKSRRIS